MGRDGETLIKMYYVWKNLFFNIKNVKRYNLLEL